MNLQLHKSTITSNKKIAITGSKSESNRLLLLQALYPSIDIANLSNSDDSQLMQKALKSSDRIIDIHHAGTAMRFLTAFYSTQKNREVELTGSKRMKERPIAILVDALRQIGADISYKENEGFPPLMIKGKQLTGNKVTLKANVSSQYISALLLIAPKLENGLKLTLEGTITSIPYIKMTLNLLSQIGVESSFKDNVITVKRLLNIKENKNLVVESDWSSASYFYSIIALSDIGANVTISSYKKESLQGDSVLAQIYKTFGVSTEFNNNSVTISKTSEAKSIKELNLQEAPDIAQTIAVTAFGLGLSCYLTGLHTLKIKETDRLVALKTEIEKLGGNVSITNDSLTLEASNSILNNVEIDTYNDHRMAMAFAPLALKTDIIIKDYKVVSKSYPTYWEDLKTLGFNIAL
ncbi:3-phosphoshikimate 1-carboxyvinyltransferase [Mesoflavibacter sabulilitoris]|uniref:3-phosphoshikimate 1-carboxyvinyltransferase n=1 Tax=Mesoflavibacter zeaxanthinifaciens subsp. sabulilitoris TaxID=1520893 RepID=A0A2T1N7U2_9FLAO|nr:3-phosphoshikimate 1-carboxyvinyltransferase [Mesoflavibacter zeaxanthinifaciens]MBB3123879.1 3-phosphoshikimate 1-carboxyvinyltransferase [Mesoflavibacter zeaxanthinifaciens subsp. sabulilitoris]PSG87942.1 3-phosphoshikimate 1-carboxyvinyltransferase [Mesoflavibacter zeaxanthinifaciens subsp. sabulilitoris]